MEETQEMIETSIMFIKEKIELYIYKEDLSNLERGELDYLIELLRKFEEKLKKYKK